MAKANLKTVVNFRSKGKNRGGGVTQNVSPKNNKK